MGRLSRLLRAAAAVPGGGGGVSAGPYAVAIVADSISHGATTNTKAALEASGHTVTVVAETALSTHDFSVYDAVCCVRLTINSATVADNVRDYLLGAGVPTVLGLMESGGSSGTGRTPTAYLLGLCGTVNIEDTSAALDSEEVVNTAHPITSVFAAGELVTHTGANFWAAVNDNGTVQGTILNHGFGSALLNGKASTWAVPSGSVVDGVTLTKGLVVAGFLYGGQSAYTANGQTILDRCLQWVVGAI